MSATRTFVGVPSPTGIGRDGAGGHPCQGCYYKPPGATPRIAAIATHYSIDYTEHYLGELLAARGIGFLGWNTQYRGREAHFILDRAVADIGRGVEWLRSQGVDTIVLIGNSGGASLMAAYHAHATGHPVRPVPDGRLARGLDNLTTGDLYVQIAAHSGRPDVFTSWMDPSVIDETDPTSTDPSLDMFDPMNAPPYPPEFVERYRSAQRARNQRITTWVDAALADETGPRERLFVVPRTWADLRFMDPTIEPSTRPTPACYAGDPRQANRGIHGIGTVSTLRTWQSMWSMQHSQCLAVPHLETMRLPALVVHATADTGAHESDATAMFDAINGTDKTIVRMHADHYFRDDPAARDQLGDLVAAWITQRAR